MKIYLLTPEYPPNPHLFPLWVDEWKRQGHEIVLGIRNCDVVFFDLHVRQHEYNQADINYIVDSGVSWCSFDEFDKGGMSNHVWPNPLTPQQEYVFLNASGRQVHFCRLLDKTKKYENVYPYEKPILYEEPMLDADKLFNREYDIVWIANTAPQRERLASALRLEAKLKCNIILGAKKIPYQDWINEHKKGKLFVSCSAGGYSNECVQSLFSVAGMLKEKNDQLLAHPFTNSVNAVMISENPTREELEYLRLVVNNKYELHRIYSNCYQHMKTYYSKEAMANYVLDILKKKTFYE